MRYREFRLVENDPAADAEMDDAVNAGTGLAAGPPYPADEMDAVRALQSKLEELGYSVGSTGVDGKYGPRTSRAVSAYKRDFNIRDQDRGRSISASEITAMQSAVKKDEPTSTGNEQGGSARYELPPLSSRSDVRGAVGEVLDFIARYESAGHYDVRNGGTRDPRILNMTVAEILQYQRTAPWPGGESSAIGRYQYVRDTLEWMTGLMGINRNTQLFDEEFQDQLATYDMRRRCRLDQWLSGAIDSDQFAENLAQVWSSIPLSSGLSAHHGIGSNRAGTSFSNAVAQLDRARSDIAGIS